MTANLNFDRCAHVGYRLAPSLAEAPFGLRQKPVEWRHAFFYLLPPLFIVLRLTLFIRRRTDSEFANIDGYAGVQVALTILTCLALMVSRQTQVVLKRVLSTSVGVLLLLHGFQGLSALWSVMPEYSLFRAVEVASQFLAVIVGISCFREFLKAETAVLILGLLVAFLGVIGTLKMTHFSSLRTNQYAAGASMVLCYCFAEMPGALGPRRVLLGISAVLGFLMVAAGGCSTANVATCAGLVAGALLSRNRNSVLLIVAMVVFTVALVPLLGGDLWENLRGVLFPGKSDSQLLDLHGRVPMWKTSLEIATASPFVGHGFAVQNRVAGINVTTHNSYVQVFLDTGIIGVSLFTLSILMFANETWRQRRFPVMGLTGCVAAFTSVLVHSMGIPIIGAQWLAPSFTFAAFAGLYVNHIRTVANQQFLRWQF